VMETAHGEFRGEGNFRGGARSGRAAIEIRLSRPQQLFNSLDPSPFHETGSRPGRGRLPGGLGRRVSPEEAVDRDHPHAGRPAASWLPSRLGAGHPQLLQLPDDETHRRLKFFFRDGRIALVVALAFLLGCILLRQSPWPSGRASVCRSWTRVCTSLAGWPCGAL